MLFLAADFHDFDALSDFQDFAESEAFGACAVLAVLVVAATLSEDAAGFAAGFGVAVAAGAGVAAGFGAAVAAEVSTAAGAPPAVRPALTEQTGQAPGPCEARTFSAMAICCALVARLACGA